MPPESGTSETTSMLARGGFLRQGTKNTPPPAPAPPQNGNGSGHFKIESDVPVPIQRGGRTSMYIGTMQRMKVGDSFVCPGQAPNMAALRNCAKRLKIKIVCRCLNDKELRVWRIE